MAGNGKEAVCGRLSKQRCGNCSKTGYNTRTCKKDVEESSYLDSE
jgi:hypothetical protein